MHTLSLPISHNDLAYEIRSRFLNQLDQVDLNTSTDVYGNQWQTDIPWLRAGRVGAQVSNQIASKHSTSFASSHVGTRAWEQNYIHL